MTSADLVRTMADRLRDTKLVVVANALLRDGTTWAAPVATT